MEVLKRTRIIAFELHWCGHDFPHECRRNAPAIGVVKDSAELSMLLGSNTFPGTPDCRFVDRH